MNAEARRTGCDSHVNDGMFKRLSQSRLKQEPAREAEERQKDSHTTAVHRGPLEREALESYGATRRSMRGGRESRGGKERDVCLHFQETHPANIASDVRGSILSSTRTQKVSSERTKTEI